MKLLEELFANGVLSEQKLDELQKEVEKSGKTEEEVILENNIVSEDSLFALKSKFLKIPLSKTKPEDVPLNVLDLIPEEASLNYKMAALAKDENSIDVGMVYPEDIAAQNALRFLAGQQNFNYKVFLITISDLNEFLKQRKSIKIETKKALEELAKERGGSLDVLGAPIEQKNVITGEAPIIKMVLVILRYAIEAKASDIHIEPGRDKLLVRFRVFGILHSSLFLPLKVHPSIVARIKIISSLKIDENRIPQDGRFSAKINNQDIDFRVSTFPTLYGEKVEIRVLDSSQGKKSFEELGLFGRNLELVKEAIKKPYGLILFVGPTGSGKTTTQYAILRVLNQEGVNIVTLEDPIEYAIAGVNQSQVKPEIGYNFASGLRQILRQDPNVIMVGEVRDEETAGLVINAALTGHVVLSTLHTNSAAGAVPRLMDMGVKPFLIPSTLKLVISQRLIRTLCQKCKIKIRPAEKAKNYLQEKIKTMPAYAKNGIKSGEALYVYGAKGCEDCNFTGYAGRVGLFEILSMTENIADLILEKPGEGSILKAVRKQGMLTMEQEGVLKILAGQTTVEEVMRATEERE